ASPDRDATQDDGGGAEGGGREDGGMCARGRGREAILNQDGEAVGYPEEEHAGGEVAGETMVSMRHVSGPQSPAARRSAGVLGSVTYTVVPTPIVGSHHMRPPCCSTIRRQIAMPRLAVPSAGVVYASTR